MAYKHLFFDLDHTIWDFQRNSEEAIREVYIHFSLERLGKMPFEAFLGRYRQVNGSLWNEYNHGKIDKENLRLERFKRVLHSFGLNDLLEPSLLEEMYMDVCPRKPHLVEGALEVLHYLRDRGYLLHIVTNGFEETTVIKMASSGIADLFEIRATSEGLAATKPNRQFFEKALAMAGCGIEGSLMIGDNLDTDIKGALAMGMDQVYFNPEKKKHKLIITYEIERLEELKGIL